MNQNEEIEFTKKENEQLKYEAQIRENERLKLKAIEAKRKDLEKRLEEKKSSKKKYWINMLKKLGKNILNITGLLYALL